jgi:Asp-tRNA(Asn)/Glu-tRNA(Gln) amidotransferase A subunit family amidase
VSTAAEHAVDALRRAPASATACASVPPITRTPAETPLGGVAWPRTDGATTSVQLTRRALQRARRWPGVVTDLDQREHQALQAAAEADHRRAVGEPLGALDGLPVLVKDNVDVAGLVSGQGGTLGRHRATADSAVAGRLAAQGGVVLGHTAMHELAWGLTTPGCPNPWGAGLSPGGSSGGAAASVAAGIVTASIGTDTGGSVRVPAALCGVAGLRPTHGISALRGIAPLAPSLDTVGVLAATAAECVLAHELLARPGAAAPAGLSGLRVGVLAGWRGRVSAGVEAAIEDTCTALRGHGVHVIDLELPQTRLAPSIAYVLMLIESARQWLAEAERDASVVAADVLGQLRDGGRIDGPDGPYELALALARALCVQVEHALHANGLTALLLPVTASAGIHGSATPIMVRDREMNTVDALSRYTALASVTGLPALSVPAGLDAGCPVGVQLIGAPYDERALALLAHPVEQGPGRIVRTTRDKLEPWPQNP